MYVDGVRDKRPPPDLVYTLLDETSGSAREPGEDIEDELPMSVLVQAISVIVRSSSIVQKYPGGMAGYARDCPNRTFCADKHLTRVGFMDQSDVRAYVGRLQMQGLSFVRDGFADEIVIVDQFDGPTLPCSWIEFARQGNTLSCCWLKGAPSGVLATPRGWAPGKIVRNTTGSHLVALGHVDGADVFRDEETGAKLYRGRAVFRDSSTVDLVAEARRRLEYERQPWQVGERLGGNWPIYKIMTGAMGVVYVVHDRELAGLVAAKTFRDEAFRVRGSEAADRFRREALAWIRVGFHPNIVRAHKVVSIRDKPYLFLEYVSGGPLSSWIGTPRLMGDPSRVLKFGIDFCRGMTFALGRGIVAHRDIKPDNCLVTPEGTLKITDFGLVKALDDWESPGRREGTLRALSWQRLGKAFGRLFGGDRSGNQRASPRAPGAATRTGLVGGTPAYMAPEQFDEMKSVDVRADIYSFGVMLFQMVTGRLPFDGNTLEELRRGHKEISPPDVSTSNRALRDGIRKCLAKEPAERFETFEAVNVWLAELYRRERGVPLPPEGEKEELGIDAIAHAHNFWSLGMRQEAIICCDEAIRSSAESVEAWSLKGGILGVMGRSGEALRCHERAIAIDGGSATAWHWMGVTRYWGGEFAEAVACYDRLLAIDPQNPKAWYDKGVSLQREGRIEEATACWSRCLALDPNHSMAWCNQGAGLAELGDEEAAISCYKRALVLDPRDERAWYNLGQQLASRADRYAEALQCLEMAEKLGFQSATEAKVRILARMKQGRGGPTGRF